MGNLCASVEKENDTQLHLSQKSKKNKTHKSSKTHKHAKKRKSKKDKNKKKGASIVNSEIQEPTEIKSKSLIENWDENDISTLLPSEPTLDDANHDQDNLSIMKEAWNKAISFGNALDEAE